MISAHSSLLNENFDSYPTGSEPPGWTIVYGPPNTTVEVVDDVSYSRFKFGLTILAIMAVLVVINYICVALIFLFNPQEICWYLLTCLRK